MKIASLSIADYCEATQGMDHLVERLFFRMMLWMFSSEAMIPDDDEANANRFGYHIRRYRRLKAELLASPKAVVVVRDGMIVSDRAAREIEVVQAKKEAARESGRRGGLAAAGRNVCDQKGVDTIRELTSEFGAKSANSAPEKANENNKSEVPTPSPSPTVEKKEKIDKTEPVSQSSEPPERVAAKAADRPAQSFVSEKILGIFGAKNAVALVKTVSEALPHHVDQETASDWLEAEVADHGQVALRAAHNMLIDKRASGVRIVKPLAWWSKTAGTLAAKARAVSTPTSNSPAESEFMRGVRERVAARAAMAAASTGGVHA